MRFEEGQGNEDLEEDENDEGFDEMEEEEEEAAEDEMDFRYEDFAEEAVEHGEVLEDAMEGSSMECLRVHARAGPGSVYASRMRLRLFYLSTQSRGTQKMLHFEPARTPRARWQRLREMERERNNDDHACGVIPR